MMIDAETESLIPLAEVPNLPLMPGGRGGKRICKRTISRWATIGLKGVKLEVVIVGEKRCTTASALLAFFESVQAAAGSNRPSTPKQQAVSQKRAYAILERYGIKRDGTATR